MRLTAKRLIVGLAVCALLTLVGLLGGVGAVLRPDPAPQELTSERRSPASRTTRTNAPAESGLVTVRGLVTRPDGAPVSDFGIHLNSAKTGRTPSAGALLATTGADGTFHLELEAPVELVPGATASPRVHRVTSDRSDLRFVAPDLCGLDIVVDGPIDDTLVTVGVSIDADEARQRLSEIVQDGRAHFPDAVCGVAKITATAPDLAPTRRSGVDTVVESEVRLTMGTGVLVSGTVSDSDGEPILEAMVRAGPAYGVTDDQGLFELRVGRSDLTNLRASADGYESDSMRLRPAPDEVDVEVDFILTQTRIVKVWCAGRPDDSCAGVRPIFCTSPLNPLGDICRGDRNVSCECPVGEAAVRGGGTSVRVDEGQDEAWLDMRWDGSISATVVANDTPIPCDLDAMRLPEGLEDLPKGGFAGQTASCDDDGAFRLIALKPGKWNITLRAAGITRSLPPVDIDGDHVDLGTIDIEGGATISGTVLDGLTGDGAANQVVAAIRTDADPEHPSSSQTISTSEGRFSMRGLEDGEYEVLLAMRPFDTHPVTVTDGVADTEVTLETGAAPALTEQGIGLETDIDGQLVVNDPGKNPDLEEGDVITGVTLMGFDVGEAVPGMEDQLTDAVLEHWSGPGVGIIVDRDGTPVEIDLD